jgi:hypothetical protein
MVNLMSMNGQKRGINGKASTSKGNFCIADKKKPLEMLSRGF